MSSLLDTLTTSSSQSKCCNMKQFINAAREYSNTKAEDTASLINRYLQVLSVTIDLNIFDPHTSVASEFFVSLHELLSSLEPRSALAWCCVNVLGVACRNPSARHALIHTYQFLPLLARLLGDHLTIEKRVRLLSVMQEISCGIKISWQIPHLQHLMKTLTAWIGSQHEEIVTQSLGVLVNLCYKNLSAIYTLSRCVDLKHFVRQCMTLKGLRIEVHVCKLLIILDHMNGQVPQTTFLKLVDVTFKSMTEAFRKRDAILLRHCVEFFLDVHQQNNNTEAFANFNNCEQEISQLLTVVENNLPKAESGDHSQHEPECIALLLEFLHSLLEGDLPQLRPFRLRIAKIALEWIQAQTSCYQALAVLQTIALHSNLDDNLLQELFFTGLSTFLIALTYGEQSEVISSIEQKKRLNALMQLLRALIRANDGIRAKVLRELKEDHLVNVFKPLLGENEKMDTGDIDSNSAEAISLYVHAAALVSELAKYDMQWTKMYDSLMQFKQIQMMLAQGLYGGSEEIRTSILGMVSNVTFPTTQLAHVMTTIQPLMHDTSTGKSNGTQMLENLDFPVMSMAQLNQLDTVMNKLKEALAQNPVNVATSDVMELYDYKLASMGHAERAAMASVEAATQRCTHLEHRTAQLTAELSRLHQLLLQTQHQLEKVVQLKTKLEENNNILNSRMEVERGKCETSSKMLHEKMKLLAEKEQHLEATAKKLQNVCESRAQLEEKLAEFSKVIERLEETHIRKEQVIQKKVEALKVSNTQNEHLTTQNMQLERKLKDTEGTLAVTRDQLTKVTVDLQSRKELIATITRLTHSQDGVPK